MPGFSRRRAKIAALARAGVAPAFSAPGAISASADFALKGDLSHVSRRNLLAEDDWFCTWMRKTYVTCPASSGCAAADGCVNDATEGCIADYATRYGPGTTDDSAASVLASPYMACYLDRTSSSCVDSSMSNYLTEVTTCDGLTTEATCNAATATHCNWETGTGCAHDAGAYAQTNCPVLFAEVSGPSRRRRRRRRFRPWRRRRRTRRTRRRSARCAARRAGRRSWATRATRRRMSGRGRAASPSSSRRRPGGSARSSPRRSSGAC